MRFSGLQSSYFLCYGLRNEFLNEEAHSMLIPNFVLKLSYLTLEGREHLYHVCLFVRLFVRSSLSGINFSVWNNLFGLEVEFRSFLVFKTPPHVENPPSIKNAFRYSDELEYCGTTGTSIKYNKNSCPNTVVSIAISRHPMRHKSTFNYVSVHLDNFRFYYEENSVLYHTGWRTGVL